ncbi:MAG: 16S rRNA (cytidine(1402)-2'-O)-methyltransferase [Acutalibacteraceae bacterium]|jgi:16S rRNA (cytidine1402-2'-O)-methyltransferase
MSGTLTLVGTPIGNLSDLSPRAVEALKGCDLVAAEDTRVTLRLLNHFGIKKPLVSYYDPIKAHRGPQICERLEAGENVALVSDAGMPAISDPGEDLVALCVARGIPVTVVPGPTAVATAVALAGLPGGRFVFEGFLPPNKKIRRERLEELQNERRLIVLYEAPHKLSATLDELLAALGDRRIALARELTKLHEEVLRTTLSQAAERYRREEPRGEFVLVIEGAPKREETVDPKQAAAAARALMAKGLSPSEAAKQAAAGTGLKKGDVYRELIKGE